MLHVLSYVCVHLVLDEQSSFGVVTMEGGHIENEVVVHQQHLVCLLDMELDFLQVFELQVDVVLFDQCICVGLS